MKASVNSRECESQRRAVCHAAMCSLGAIASQTPEMVAATALKGSCVSYLMHLSCLHCLCSRKVHVLFSLLNLLLP